MKHLKEWGSFVVFLVICFIFGEFSLLIRWQNAALLGLFVVSIVFAQALGDVTKGLNNDESGE